MKGICSICARGGSKGIPGKNIKMLGDKPLIAHSIHQAKEADIFSVVAVSSDSEEILNVAKKYGADIIVKRPKELANDQVGKLPAIRHCALKVEEIMGEQFDFYVDIDATSPLRIPEDIIESVNLLLKKTNTSNVFSVSPSRRSPYFNMVEEISGKIQLIKSLEDGFTRRQDAPSTYDMNASIYAWKRDALFGQESLFDIYTKVYLMPEERSFDIDHPLDFEIVEFLFNRSLRI